MVNLSNVTLVIGGSGLIGQAVANGLVSSGQMVVSLDTANESPPEEALASPPNVGKLDVGADALDRESLRRVLASLDRLNLVPTGLVYMAHYKGDVNLTPGAPFFSSFEDYPFDEWQKTMDVNLSGLFNVCQIFGSKMARLGRGSIVTLSSTYGVVGPDQSIYGDSGINSPIGYATSKAAVIGFTRYLASYWGRSGVRVNCLVPGGVRSDGQSEQFRRSYAEKTLLGRMAEASEYLGAVRFMLSDESSYMTGATLTVDGGWTAV